MPNASIWGIPYEARVVPADSLNPFDGRVRGYVVEIEAGQVTPFLVAHEAAHLYAGHHRLSAAAFTGQPCPVQAEWHCNPEEARADTFAFAAVKAGCLAGDFGWPGEPASGCVLPDPAQVRP